MRDYNNNICHIMIIIYVIKYSLDLYGTVTANGQKMGRKKTTNIPLKHCNVVLGKSCQQLKHTAVHGLPRQKMPPLVLPRQQMPKATFSQPYMCTKKTN